MSLLALATIRLFFTLAFGLAVGRFKHRWTVRQVDGRAAKMVDQDKVREWLEDYLRQHHRLPGLVEVNFAAKADRKLDHGGDYANKVIGAATLLSVVIGYVLKGLGLE